ncbi:response regulator transcription factor [uncultured Acetobacteroides sp.]|uniref:response regulator transcription factor n=1 Tax=uncultured Acetobacteroides sp. TaxID=1760811 RepID=UPI0029F5837F|nr:response regulator transcription factor [uncultured Acetobacteroides sp.]
MEEQDSSIRIGIVDDEALIVMLLSDFFAKHERISVEVTATGGQQIIDAFGAAQSIPEILLLDLQMGEMNGIDTATVLKQSYPDLKIIVVSSHYKKSFMGYMLKLGVNAFLPKGIAPLLLAEAIEEVHAKGFYFMGEQIEVMRNQIAANVPAPALKTEEELSEREVEVLRLLCMQYTAPQIAEKLFIAKRTVDFHKTNLLEKTSSKNIAGLVIYAIQKRLIDIDDCFFTLTE